MANQRIDTMVLKQLILLHLQGWSNRKIATSLGISRNTVNGYIRCIEQGCVDVEQMRTWEEEELDQFFNRKETKPADRYVALEAYFPEVLKASTQVGFTHQKMWETYRGIHSDGYSYTQFMTYYHRWHQVQKPTLKLTHKAGENMLTDYAGKKLQWVNRDTGEVTQVDVFISCLPASGLMYVEASPNQQKEHFIHSMRCSLEYFGGVPKVSVTDNLKSAVSKPSKYEAIVNRTFRDMGLHYGMVLNPTRPYRPQDKAMVERLVQLVYTEIYFPMRNELFFSLAELNDRIWELLEELNKRKFSQSEESRRTLFESIEKPVLKPLPPQPYQIKKTSRAKVQKSGHVYLSEDKHYYSVPYRYIGHLTRIHYTEKVVEVYFNHQRIATHLRDRQSIGYTTKSEHLTEQHQKYSQWDATYFIQKAKKIGPQCTQYIQRLFDQQGYTQTKYKTAMGIVQLQRLFEIERIEKACQLACIYPTASYQTVKNILEKGLDKLDDLFTPPNSSSHIPPHSNIRGAEYYSNN